MACIATKSAASQTQGNCEFLHPILPTLWFGLDDRSIAHGIANQATTVMIRARAAITMIAHSMTQIANGTRRFRCMFGQIKRGEVFCTLASANRGKRVSAPDYASLGRWVRSAVALSICCPPITR